MSVFSYFQVKNYHKKFYRPENVLIIIVGQVNSNDVIKALQPIERKIYAKVKLLYFHTNYSTTTFYQIMLFVLVKQSLYYAI